MKTVTINPGNVSFQVDEEETILSAALKNGWLCLTDVKTVHVVPVKQKSLREKSIMALIRKEHFLNLKKRHNHYSYVPQNQSRMWQ